MSNPQHIFSKKALGQRQSKVAELWSSQISNQEIVLIWAGEERVVPGGLDQVFPYKPHPDYYWLTGNVRAGGVMCFCRQDGFVEFQRSMSAEEVLWEGGREPSPTGRPLSELQEYLKSFKSENQIHMGFREFDHTERADYLAELRASLHRCRRKKDAEELNLIRKASGCAQKGYERVHALMSEGASLTERQLQLEYEYQVLSAGSDQMPYSSIVGSGENSAVLHAMPTTKTIQKGELVLIDAGAEIHDYCVDITRVFCQGNQWTTQQRELYQAVLKAQTAAFETIRVGVRWGEVHLAAARSLAESLRSLNLLRVAADEAVESGVISVFFPHGVGHLMGLKVRDTGHLENKDVRKYAGAKIRVDLELEENMVLTVEPGCYFVRALLENSETQTQFHDSINWNEVEKWKSVGGVRIEDDIRVLNSSSSSFENLTASISKFSF
jgi:Xaa-Pro aminopeptidase